MDHVVIGAPVLVNTHTLGAQGDPSLATLADGSYVVVWSSQAQDGYGSGTYLQRFDRFGNPLGVETLINTTTDDNQWQPRVAALADGGFVVAWMSANQAADGWDIYQQRYDATGAPVGGETLVNTHIDINQEIPAITALEGGGWVVTWRSMNQDGSGFGVYAQQYNAAGDPVGGETLVNTLTVSDQWDATVTALADGGYVVAWMNYSSEEDWGIRFQRYDADGDPVGGETPVSAGTDYTRFPDISALADGGFVVTWADDPGNGQPWGMWTQRYDAGGAPVGGGVLAGVLSGEDIRQMPVVLGLEDGGWVVAYGGQGDQGLGLYFEIYDSAGTKTSTERIFYGGGGYEIIDLAATDIGFRVAYTGFQADQDVYTRTFHVFGLNPIEGTAAADTLTGTAGDDLITGLGDNDVLRGEGADDTIEGGQGDDAIYGDFGADTLDGGGGTDFIQGGGDADTLNGGDDGDVLQGGDGDDILNGDDGHDNLSGGEGADAAFGGEGDDDLRGANGDDSLSGGLGGDALYGGEDNDSLYGEAGDDLLRGGNGSDYVSGGDGADNVRGEAGDDILLGGVGADTMLGGDGADELSGGVDADVLRGEAGDDVLRGQGGDDVLRGGEGLDTLTGGDGKDVLEGGADADKLYGQSGDDTLLGGAGADRFVFKDDRDLGHDRILDFENGVDRIRFIDAGVDEFSDLTVSANGSGWAVVTLPNGTQITLNNVAVGDVDASDFLWT